MSRFIARSSGAPVTHRHTAHPVNAAPVSPPSSDIALDLASCAVEPEKGQAQLAGPAGGAMSCIRNTIQDSPRRSKKPALPGWKGSRELLFTATGGSGVAVAAERDENYRATR